MQLARSCLLHEPDFGALNVCAAKARQYSVRMAERQRFSRVASLQPKNQNATASRTSCTTT
jgi:hypothetical protein